RKHLCRLAVRTIDEHLWCQRIGERKATKLLRVEVARIVVKHHAADHHHHAQLVGLPDECAQRIRPGRTGAARLHAETQCVTKLPCCFDRRRGRGQAAYKRQWRLSRYLCMIAVPVLSLLAGIDRIEQVGTGPRDRPIGHRAEIRDRQRFVRRHWQEEIAHRRMGRTRKTFQLPQRGLHLARFPSLKPGKPCRHVNMIQPGAITRPAEQVRTDSDSGHTGILAKLSKQARQRTLPLPRSRPRRCGGSKSPASPSGIASNPAMLGWLPVSRLYSSMLSSTYVG